MKELILLVYIVMYAASLAATAKLSRLLRGKQPSSFASQENGVLLRLIGLFLPLALLAGYFDFGLLLLYLAALQLGVALTLVMRTFAVEASPAPLKLTHWSDFEFHARHPVLALSSLVVLILCMVSEPIVSAVLLFSYERPSEELTRLLILVSLGASLIVAPVGHYLGAARLVSPQLDESTRADAAIRWIAHMVPFTLDMSIFLWALGWSSRATRRVGGIGLSTSLPLVALVLAFLLLAVMLPYFVGVTRGKRQRTRFLRSEQHLLRQLSTGLEVPSPALYTRTLTELAQATKATAEAELMASPLIATAYVRHIEPDRQVAGDLALEAVPSQTVEQIDQLFNEEVAVTDPRFVFQERLAAFRDLLDQIRGDVQRKRTESSKVTVANNWAQVARRRADDLQQRLDELKRARVPLTLRLGVIAAPFLSVAVEQAAKAIWNLVTRTT